jgi:hypothetical protein
MGVHQRLLAAGDRLTISREVKEFLPLGLTALAIWGGYKVLSTEVPAIEGAINSRLAPSATTNTPAGTTQSCLGNPPLGYLLARGASWQCVNGAWTIVSSATGNSVPCTKNGIYWTQQTDGTYYGKPYCPPGVPCSQLVMVQATNPC